MTQGPLNYASPQTDDTMRTRPRRLVGAIRLVAFAVVVLAGAILAGLGSLAAAQTIYGAQAFSIGCFIMGIGGIFFVIQLVLTFIRGIEQPMLRARTRSGSTRRGSKHRVSRQPGKLMGDLRATPGLCPECGHIPDTAAS